jgi:hypothetical protein
LSNVFGIFFFRRPGLEPGSIAPMLLRLMDGPRITPLSRLSGVTVE